MNNKSFFGLVVLTVACQLRVGASLLLPNSCELPFKGEDNCRGTNGLPQQTLPLGNQRSASERQAASGPMGEKPEVEAERATGYLVLMTPHRLAHQGFKALLARKYKEAG